MNKINSSLLNNTLSLLQMASAVAREKGVPEQVERFEPVVDHLTNLLASSDKTKSTNADGIFGQNDFSELLSVANSERTGIDINERMREKNNMIFAMSAGGMNDLEIARYMGITRDEVRVILNLSKQNPTGGGI